MRKIVRFVVWPLLAVIVILGAIAAYIAATFDPNHYKPQVVQAVKDKTQRTLKLDGNVKLTFIPSIGATLDKASLSERGNEREFAAAEDLHVALKLVPLLSKQVVIDAIEANNLRASVLRYKDGKTNIDDLTGAGSTSKAGDQVAPSAVTVDIDHITLKNAAITYVDQEAGAKYELAKLNVKTGRIANGIPSKVDIAFNAQSDKPKLDVDAALNATVTFDPPKQHYALEGLDLTARGAAAGITDLVLSAKGDVDAKIATKEFLVSKLSVAGTGKQEGADLNIKLDVPKLNATKDKVSGEKVVLDATMTDAKGKKVIKLEVPAIGGNAQAFQAAAMTLAIDMQQSGAATKVKLTSPLAGSIDAEKLELAKFVAAVIVNDPKLPKNPIDATITGGAVVDLARQNASMTFATKFDESNVNGKAGLTRFSPPFYTFEINVDQLDADRYMPKTEAKKQPEQPLDLSALKGLNATGSVRIGSLKVANVKAANVRIEIKAADGRVDVRPIAANLYQGTLAGALSLQAAVTPVITVKQNLTGVNVGPLLKDAVNFDTLEGRGNLSVDVNGQGNTVSAITKALNGNAALRLTDGAIKGINIAGSIRGAKEQLGALRGERTQAASQTEKTDFSELAASFDIKNGVAHNSDLSGKSPLLRLGGAGDIDIGNERLDYLVKATVVASAAGQGGKELAQLKGVTVPVKLTGSFSSPQYAIDFSGMAASAAKALVETNKEEIKGKVQDQVMDKLKGLLGR